MMKKAPEEEPTIWNMEYSRKDSRSPANAAAGSAGRDDEGVTDEDRSIGHISSAGKKSTTTSQLKHDDDFYLKSPFPWKLQQMLEDVSSENKEEIISWVPEGNAFQIHRSSSFERDIMPKYFRQTKYKSFTRQVSRSAPSLGSFDWNFKELPTCWLPLFFHRFLSWHRLTRIL